MYVVCTTAHDSTTLPNESATSPALAIPELLPARTTTRPTASRLATDAHSRSRSVVARLVSSRLARLAVVSASSHNTIGHTHSRKHSASASQPTSTATSGGKRTPLAPPTTRPTA